MPRYRIQCKNKRNNEKTPPNNNNSNNNKNKSRIADKATPNTKNFVNEIRYSEKSLV